MKCDANMTSSSASEKATGQENRSTERLVELAEESTRGGVSLFLGNASAIFITALVAIVVARLLGPANYGLFSLSIVIPHIAVVAADLGLGPALTRYSAKLTSESRTAELAVMVRSVFTVRLLVASLILALVLVFSEGLASLVLRRPGIADYVRLASLLILFQTVFSATNSTLIGLGRMKAAGLMMTVQSGSRGVAMPALILVGFSVAGAVLGHASSYAFGAAIGVAAVMICFRETRYMRMEGGSYHVESLKTAVRYGAPLYVMAFLTIILAQYQNIVLAQTASDVEIGNFNAAVNLSLAMNVVAFPITTALFPAFSKLNPRSENEELKRMFTISVKYASLLLVPSSIFVAVLSKDLVFTIYGRSFQTAPEYLSIYVLMFVFVALGYLILAPLFNGIGETKETLKMTALAVALFLPSAPLIVQAFHVKGLIVAYLASNFAGIGYGLYSASRRLDLKPDLGGSLRILVASAISALPAFLLLSVVTLPSIFNIVAGGFVYLVTYLTCLPLIGAVRMSDVDVLSQILGRIRLVNLVIRPIMAYERRLLSIAITAR